MRDMREKHREKLEEELPTDVYNEVKAKVESMDEATEKKKMRKETGDDWMEFEYEYNRLESELMDIIEEYDVSLNDCISAF